MQLFADEYSIGKEWGTEFIFIDEIGRKDTRKLKCRMVARESITVPAGTFHAVKARLLP
jgi:hypothetical protein